MKYFMLIGKNVTRKKTRMVLTVASYMVALSLFGFLVAYNDLIVETENIGTDIILVTQKKAGRLTLTAKEKMRKILGIKLILGCQYIPGYYQDQKNTFPIYAYETAFREVWPEIFVEEEQWESYLNDQTGCLVGKNLAKKYGWKIGDKIPIRDTRAFFESPWEFNLKGFYRDTQNEGNTGQMYFHYEYYDKRTGDSGFVGFFMVKIHNPEDANQIASAIDNAFENSTTPTQSESYQAYVSGIIKQYGNIKERLLALGAAAFFSLLLVTGTSMAVTIKERTGEMAVLKTLGFSDMLILFIVLSEAILYSLMGGGLGLCLAKLYTVYGDKMLENTANLTLSFQNIVIGLLIAILFGAVSGIIPALNASRQKIVDALRSV